MTTLTVPTQATAASPEPPRNPARRRRFERGGLVALLLGTALLYMVDLGASGYGNEFYAAAVQAGTKSWKAFFFGSFDSSNFITVDKPPMSLWPMELSGRIFGFNAWSMLLPQAIEGVLTVWLLYATVRRWFGASAGFIAGAAMALTPVAVLMFRYNQPDAMMTLLIVAAAYCTTRAIEAASTKWLTLAGVAIGFSFLVKGLQPFTVLPALALAYVVAAPTSLRRRLLQLLAAAAGVLVGAGWWVAAVALTPVSDRPYIGGSGNNSALGLAFGYNGLGRITGDESTNGSGGAGGVGGGAGANFSGHTGIGRLFNSLNVGQISWLIPAAVIALVALLVVAKRAPRTDHARAAAIVWGGWLLVTGAVLSYAGGIIHTYYTVELAPAIAALVGIGAVVLWRIRAHAAARAALAAAIVVTGVWSYELLHRSANWHPAMGYVVLLAAIVAGIVVALPPGTSRRVVGAGVVAAVIAVGAGSTAYALDTAATPHNGSIPSAGPAVSGSQGGPGGGFEPRGSDAPRAEFGSTPPAGGPPGGFPGASGASGADGATLPGAGSAPAGAVSGARGGGIGGQTVSTQLVALLKATTTTWAAATVGSQSAAPLELSTGKAIMSIGGFNGSDNAPTLAQFEKLVAEGKVRYFIAGGGLGGGPGGGGSGAAITSWVEAHFQSSTVGGTTVYDLTK